VLNVYATYYPLSKVKGVGKQLIQSKASVCFCHGFIVKGLFINDFSVIIAFKAFKVLTSISTAWSANRCSLRSCEAGK